MARRVLALDTSTAWGGAALLEGDGVPDLVAEVGIGMRGSHASDLLARIDALLALAGWTRTSLDLFVACRGPGSFTGLRIGLGTVRGFGAASGRPAAGVGTLVAMAEAHGPAERPRVPLLDAGRGEFYGACYDAAGSPPAELVAPRLLPLAGVATLAAGGAVVFGPGADAVDTATAAGFRRASTPRGIAAAAGRLAAIAPPDDPESTLSPLYVRPPDALVGRPRR